MGTSYIADYGLDYGDYGDVLTILLYFHGINHEHRGYDLWRDNQWLLAIV